MEEDTHNSRLQKRESVIPCLNHLSRLIMSSLLYSLKLMGIFTSMGRGRVRREEIKGPKTK